MVTFSSLGRIYQIYDTQKGYVALVIATNVPFKTFWKKFNIWNLDKLENQFGDNFKDGDFVKFSYDVDAQFPKLETIELTSLDSCFICHAYYREENAQRLSCGMCYGAEKLDRVNDSLKLVCAKLKQYEFSKGLSLTFLEELTDVLYIACIFANNPLYNEVLKLKTGSVYQVGGWKTRRLENGNFFIDLVDAPEYTE